MTVYKVKAEGTKSVYFDQLEDALEEIKMHFEEGDASKVMVTALEMTEEEWEATPEFKGY